MPTRSPKTAADLERLKVGTLEELVDHFGSEEAARKAYERLKGRLPKRPAERPAAWWVFEDDVPDEIRQLSKDQDEEELRRRRRAWLADRFGE